MKKNLKKVSNVFFVAIAAALVTACDKENQIDSLPGNDNKVVRAVLAGYSGSEQIVEGENDINHLSALIFEDGQLTKVLENIPSSGSSYDIKVDEYKGNLYVVANTDGLLDFDSLKSNRVSEADWLRHPLITDNSTPVHFFTGSVNLSSVQQTVIPVTLKRGVARFDLRLKTAGNASVSAVTFTNLAQSAYLFPVDGEHSPADVSRGTLKTEFDAPLTTDTKAVLYVYEQSNDNIEVKVDAIIEAESTSKCNITKYF